ncbi:OBAP family protein [Azohydromonas caseinilytica]|uniref:OBAP family protein n=1 Tax=Azohydromonas caseinilytica TaxID=2728836 RepID=A0A848F973_9BURK|nr:OBAP family protein [Azohydromonas caseinilytica]NML14790.1 OBAP family protein [Azohydromonas caseinilytica]
MSSPRFFLLVVLAAVAAAIAQPEMVTPGAPKTGTTRLLEVGAKLLQHDSPLAPMDIHLVGFHPLKDDPQHQMEAHHFCRQVNEDFAQCVLFDGHGTEARLNGIEYIVSEQLFSTLPAEERRYWHPHNAEILSGQLVGPGLPAVAEVALMRRKMNSYGKTWHVWMNGDALPLGPAHLAWSFNRDGELRPELLARRDQKLEIDTAEKRRERQELVKLARPQQGVDALAAAFPGAKPIPGVVDAGASAVGR